MEYVEYVVEDKNCHYPVGPVTKYRSRDCSSNILYVYLCLSVFLWFWYFFLFSSFSLDLMKINNECELSLGKRKKNILQGKNMWIVLDAFNFILRLFTIWPLAYFFGNRGYLDIVVKPLILASGWVRLMGCPSRRLRAGDKYNPASFPVCTGNNSISLFKAISADSWLSLSYNYTLNSHNHSLSLSI